ncbi:MAG: hypothetical protein E7616_00380 [Ruminococcaceae bacterium]|nr:hypothetical protein [Oscillospiraceae bacterium]
MKPLCVMEELLIHDVSIDKACRLIAQRSPRTFMMVLMADAALVMRCAKDKTEKEACAAADLIFAQGKEMRSLAGKLGTPLSEASFTGADLLSALMAKGLDRFFFLGGEKGLARRAAVAAAKRSGRVPCPAVGGVPGNFCRKGKENTAVLTRIWECQPQVVAVCTEDSANWVCCNRNKLPPALYICAPERTMWELVGINALFVQDRMAQELWQNYRMRWMLYLYLRQRIKKLVQ